MRYFLILSTLIFSLVVNAASDRSIQADHVNPTNPGSSVHIPRIETGDIISSGQVFGLRPENVTSTTIPASDPLRKGRLVFTTDTKKLYIDDGSNFIEAGGSGGISEWFPSVNYLENSIVHENNKIYKALNNHTSTVFATDLASGNWLEISQGVTDHTQLSNIGTNTHVQIDSHIASNSNPHNVTKAQIGLSAVPDIDTSTTANISDSTNKRFVTDTEKTNIGTIPGKESLSKVTQKGGTYAGTASGATVEHPPGANGEIAVYDSSNAHGIVNRKQGSIDTESMFQYIGLEDISGNWTTGNNATFFGSGTIAGTFVKDCNTPISTSSKCSYQYTQAAGSLNDWISTGANIVSEKFRSKTVYLSVSYSYDGTSGDIVPVLYNPATSLPSDLNPILVMTATNGTTTKAIYSVTFLQAQTTVQFGYHVKQLNSGKILKFNDVKVSQSLSDFGIINGVINDEIYMLNTDNGAASTRTSYRRFTGVTSSLNNGLIRYVADSVNGDYIEALKESTIVVTYAGPYNTGATATTYVIKNATSNTPSTEANKVAMGDTGSTQWSSISGTTSMKVGDKLSFAVTSVNNTTSTMIRVTAISSTTAAAISNQQVSSDTMVFAHKATAIVASDPVGTYNTYSYAINSNTSTICATAPTQTSSDMSANGVRVFARPYNTAGTCASPARVEIKLPTGLKSIPVNAYAGAGKSIAVDYSTFTPLSTQQYGARRSYSQGSGILQLEAGVAYQGNVNTSMFVGLSSQTVSMADAYFVIDASILPALTAIPDVTCKNRYECTNELSAKVSSTGVISDQNIPWLSSCSWGAAGLADCTYLAYLRDGVSPLVNKMNCNADISQSSNSLYTAYVNNNSSTNSMVRVNGQQTHTNQFVSVDFTIRCQKVKEDFSPKAVVWANDSKKVFVKFGMSTANLTVTSGVNINFPTMYFDTHNAYSAGAYTIPESGHYQTCANEVFFNAANYMLTVRNGTSLGMLASSNTTGQPTGGCSTDQFVKGDVLSLRAIGTGNLVYSAGNYQAKISIQRIGDL